jgi:hypothetical protein
MPRGRGLPRRPVNDRFWRDLTAKTGVNKRQVLAEAVSPGVISTPRSAEFSKANPEFSPASQPR